jgi:aspartate/methionine/tyrosine aminotransferase
MLPLAEFKLERYFGKYEFAVRYLLSPSDCESISVSELLALSDAEGRRLWDELRLGYTESPGHPALRAEIARLYDSITPEQIVVAAPEELILIAMHSLLRPGDHVLCAAPAYQSLYEVARALGCEVELVWLQAGEREWRLEIDKLRGRIKTNTRLLIVNFPHNPTGHQLSHAEQAALVEMARAHGLYIFSDEMYRLLEHDPAATLPPLADVYERAVSLSGLSKTYGLPGLRLGWLASQASGLPERWLALKDYTTICNSAPSEILSVIALRAGEQLAARNRALVRANTQAAADFFARYPARLRWLAPKAGSTAFPRWLGAEPLERFCQRALDERGVMIVPGAMFDYPGPHFRVGLGRKIFPEVLEQLGPLLQSM